MSSFDTFAGDARYAMRTLRRTPGFTALAVLIFALGIGANTAIFSLVSAVLLKPLPFAEPDELVRHLGRFHRRRAARREADIAAATYVDWRDAQPSFEDIAVFHSRSYNLTGDGEPERLDGAADDAELVLDPRPAALAGRTFAPDEVAEATPVVVDQRELVDAPFRRGSERRRPRDHLGRLEIHRDRRRPAALPLPAGRFDVLHADGIHSTRSSPTAACWQVITPSRGSSRALRLHKRKPSMSDDRESLGRRDAPAEGHQGAVAPSARAHRARGAADALRCSAAVAHLAADHVRQSREPACSRAAPAAGRRSSRCARRSVRATAVVLLNCSPKAACSRPPASCSGWRSPTLSFGYLARLVPGHVSGRHGARASIGACSHSRPASRLPTVLLFGVGPAFAAARRGVNADAEERRRPRPAPRAAACATRSSWPRSRSPWCCSRRRGCCCAATWPCSLPTRGFVPTNMLVAETVLPPSKYARFRGRSAFYAARARAQ